MHAAAALTLGALAAISGASGAVLEPRLAQPTPMAGAGVKRSIETTGSLQLPLYKRDVHAGPDGKRSPEQVLAHARAQRDYVLGKWSGAMLPKEERRKRHERRQLVGLTDVGPDSFYFAQVGMGTPQQNLGIILDTGSADMWVVAADCTSSQCDGVGKYNEGASSTFQNSSQPFSVTYGQGAAQGHMCADTVSLAGYTIDSMSFGIATTLGQGTLSPPSSGLQGLGFQQLSSAGVTPFWEVLAKQGKLQTNAFTFQLARNPNAQAQDQQSPGGVFTLGEIDSNQYTGNINYVNIPSSVQQYGFWAITLDSIAVNKGSPVKLSQIAAIDTGTTLIAVPLQVASAIYQSISGSQQVPQLGQGYYAFPCTANPSITLYFGGQGYTVGSTDFNSGAIDSQGKFCLGAIFGLDTGGSAPPVIAGDAFLKNVFSVYRADNPAVGFAQLKQNGVAQTASTTGSLVQATGAPAQSQGGLGSVTSDVPAQLTNVVQEPATGTSVYFASGVSSPVARGSTVNSNPSLGSGSSGGSTSSSGGSIIGGLFGGAAPAAGAATLLVSVVSAAAALALL